MTIILRILYQPTSYTVFKINFIFLLAKDVYNIFRLKLLVELVF